MLSQCYRCGAEYEPTHASRILRRIAYSGMFMPIDPVDLIEKGAQARRERRLDDAYDAYRQAAEALRSSGQEQPLLITALTGLGQIERDRGHLDRAQGHYADALAVCRQESSSLRTAHVARHLGDICRELDKADEAENHLTEAISIYRGSPDTKVLDLANAIRPLALLKTAQGDAAGAGRLWREAQVLYTAVNVTAGAEECSACLLQLDS